MGCSASASKSAVVNDRKRTSTMNGSSIDVWEAEEILESVTKRSGHPTSFKGDGYDIGLRYKV
jgi:hypothetical protein